MMAEDLHLPPIGDLGMQPEDAVVEDDGGFGVGGAGPDDPLNLQSGEAAVEDEV